MKECVRVSREAFTAELFIYVSAIHLDFHGSRNPDGSMRDFSRSFTASCQVLCSHDVIAGNI